MNNFLITGMGRSGTKFLANFLNTGIPDYEVIHEGPNDHIHFEKCEKEPEYFKKFTDIVNLRFKYHYGEVNSYLRGIARDIQAVKKLVIIRNPYDIWLSSINRGHEREWGRYERQITEGLETIIYLIRGAGIPFIKFERMIENPYLVTDALGLPRPEKIDNVPKNAAIKRFKTLDDVFHFIRRERAPKVPSFDTFLKNFYSNERETG